MKRAEADLSNAQEAYRSEQSRCAMLETMHQQARVDTRDALTKLQAEQLECAAFRTQALEHRTGLAQAMDTIRNQELQIKTAQLATATAEAEVQKLAANLERAALEKKQVEAQLKEAKRDTLLLTRWTHASFRLGSPPRGGISGVLSAPRTNLPLSIVLALAFFLPLCLQAQFPPPLLRGPYTTNTPAWANTNVISLAISNVASKPITNHYQDGVLTLFGLEAGANISLSINGSNIVITGSAGGGGLTTNGTQFLGVPLSIITGAFLTNMNYWGDGTNNGSLYVDGNVLPVADNVYNLGGIANTWSSIVVKGVGIRFVETGGGADNILMRAPSSIGLSYSLDMPDAQGGNGQVMTNNGSGILGWWTPITSSGLTTNANQFLGVPLSIRAGALLTNVVIQQSNNTSVSLLVTNNPGSVNNIMEVYNTNRAGFKVLSNGVVDIRANVETGTNATFIVDNFGASGQTYLEFRNGGVASFVIRGDSAGNAVLSPMTGGDLFFNYDGGDGNVHWGLTAVGDVLRFIPNVATYAIHGQDTRRLQLTNVWDVFVRSNVTWAEVGGSDVVSLQSTSGMSSYTMYLPITNGLAGQVLYNVGGGELSWKDDATSPQPGLTTNANQFLGAPLSITSGVRLTNILAFELGNSAAALVITQYIGSATNALEIVASNKEPVILVTSNSVFFVKGVTGRTNDGFVVARTNGTATLMVRSNDLTVASNLVVYPLGDEVGVPYRLFNMTNSSILTNKTTSANIISNYSGRINLPANFWTPGKRVQLMFRGSYFSPAGTFTWTNAVFVGSTMIASNLVPLAASVAGDVWEEEIDIVCQNAGASGTLVCHGMCVIPSAAGGTSAVGRRVRLASGAVTVDTTAAADLSVTFHPSATTRALEIYIGHGTVYP